MANRNTMAVTTVPNVELMHAGIEYQLSTGPTTFTPEDLRDIVMAANEDSSIPLPRLGLGHIDPRFNDKRLFDGTPAFGKATNLRLDEGGMSIRADFEGVPEWLAPLLPTAYPNRSVEAYWDVDAYTNVGPTPTGKTWRCVVESVKLLGVVWPGISVIEDLPMYFGSEVPDGVVITQATRGGFTMDVKAAANLDDVRRAFYNSYAMQNEDALWWWIQAVLVDPNELICEDDQDGDLYRIPFSASDDGDITFGDPTAVKIEYVDQPSKEQKVAAARYLVQAVSVGRNVAATYASRAESRPQAEGSRSMDPKEIRTRLGLPEDATDEQLQAKLDELNRAVGGGQPAAPAVTPVSTGNGGSGATPEDAPEPIVQAAPTSAAPAPVTASGAPEIVQMTKEQYDGLIAGAQAGTRVEQRFIATEIDTLVSAAIGDGRIAPADKDGWVNYLKNPVTAEGGKTALASLKPGLIPVQMRELGSNAPGGEGHGPDLAAMAPQWNAELFPEIRDRNQQAAAIAAGHMPRPRIFRDEV